MKKPWFSVITWRLWLYECQTIFGAQAFIPANLKPVLSHTIANGGEQYSPPPHTRTHTCTDEQQTNHESMNRTRYENLGEQQLKNVAHDDDDYDVGGAQRTHIQVIGKLGIS